MNCKPGDLVMIFRTGAAGHGQASRIARAAVGRPARVTHLRLPESGCCTAALVWDFEQPVRVRCDGKDWFVTGAADAVLRPLRDGDDETLAWAGRPRELST